MKKLFTLIFVVLSITACAPTAAQVVALPIETQIAIAGLVGLLVMLLFNLISVRLPWTTPFLSRWKEELTALLAGVVTGWLSNILPGGAFEQASIWGVNFVIALIVGLLSYGAFLFGRNVKAKFA